MKKYCLILLSGLFITTLLFGCNANISVRNSTYSSHILPSHLLKKDIFSYPYLNMKKSENTQNLLSRYYGSVHLNPTIDGLAIYDISVIHVDSFFQYNIYLKLDPYTSKCGTAEGKLQELVCPVEILFPESIEQGLLVLDVNHDGSDDFLMELGIMGHMYHSICFVYDSNKQEYVEVPGFRVLDTPVYYPEQGYFIVQSDGDFIYEDGYRAQTDKYIIEENRLILIEQLLYKYLGDGEGEGYRYRVQQIRDGEIIITQKDVLEEEIIF